MLQVSSFYSSKQTWSFWKNIFSGIVWKLLLISGAISLHPCSTLGHCWGDTFTCLMIIIAFYDTVLEPKVAEKLLLKFPPSLLTPPTPASDSKLMPLPTNQCLSKLMPLSYCTLQFERICYKYIFSKIPPVMMMDCFCGMVDQQKACSLISSRDHCQRSSPWRICDMPRSEFEPG